MIGWKVYRGEFVENLRSTVSILEKENSRAQTFVKAIEAQEWDVLKSNDDEKDSHLIQALLTLKETLVNFNRREQEKIWVNENLAVVGNLIQKHQDNMNILVDEVLKKVVRCCEGNQGAIFIHQDHNGSEFLEMTGLYAYGKKKYEEKMIGKGQGLVGQVFMEGGMTMLTEVPRDYVKITSGLGEATPRCLVISVLETNDKKLGVMELAFFKKPDAYQLEFLKIVCENIARAIHWVKESERTMALLSHSELLSENLRSQEEALRKNVEEMQVIQEDMARKNKELFASQKEIETRNVEIEELNRLIESKMETQQMIYEAQLKILRKKINELSAQPKFQLN